MRMRRVEGRRKKRRVEGRRKRRRVEGEQRANRANRESREYLGPGYPIEANAQEVYGRGACRHSLKLAGDV